MGSIFILGVNVIVSFTLNVIDINMLLQVEAAVL